MHTKKKAPRSRNDFIPTQNLQFFLPRSFYVCLLFEMQNLMPDGTITCLEVISQVVSCRGSALNFFFIQWNRLASQPKITVMAR
jgi:hypothetical protein